MKPDFICIGAQKCGTSWLYKNLVKQPALSMPPVKELHYFDRSEHYPTPNKLAETLTIKRILSPKYCTKAAHRI